MRWHALLHRRVGVRMPAARPRRRTEAAVHGKATQGTNDRNRATTRAHGGDGSDTCKKIPSTARRPASHSGGAAADATILPLDTKARHPQMSGEADPHLGGHGPKCRRWWKKVKRVAGVEGEDDAADTGSRGGGCVEVLGFTASRNSTSGLRSLRRRWHRSLERLPLRLSPFFFSSGVQWCEWGMRPRGG
jgi:hypothetical protein